MTKTQESDTIGRSMGIGTGNYATIGDAYADSVQNYAAPINTPSGGGHSIAGTGYANVGRGTGGYSTVENYAAPMNTPDTGYATLGDAYADSLAQSGVTFTDDVASGAAANGASGNDTGNDNDGVKFTHGDEKYQSV